MVWRPDDRWRVSSLIHAFLELILALCVLLCAIISVTTSRLIKSSGLFSQTCVSCDIHHQHHARRQGSLRSDDGRDVTDHPKLASCDLPSNRSGSFRNIVCEECTRSLSDCACTFKHGSLADDDNSSRGKCLYNAVASVRNQHAPVDYCGTDHTIWAIDVDESSCQRKRRGGSCSSFENVDSSCDGSERIVIDGAATVAAPAYGCECRRCVASSGALSPPSRSNKRRAVKRKFAKVFPNDSRGGSSCCCGNPAHVFAEGASLTEGVGEGGGPVDVRASPEGDGGLLVHMDGSSSRFLSDGSDAQPFGRFAPEDSVRVSSQESFSYNTSRSSPRGLSRCAEVSRSRPKLSIDSDFLGGGSTPEWCRSLADSPALGNGREMEEEQDAGSAEQHDTNPAIGVLELREALQEEQEALAAVYLELEEERDAASSAAYEAMAMITRLQEEKAAIQMEARQYQRMAEEKHEYDQESMALLQEILLRRDAEVYALEEELNQYRDKLLTYDTNELLHRSGGGAKDISGSPTDVLLIERETLLLEGSESWKNRRDKRDEKLLAEIKNWLHEANEKVVAQERIEELNVLDEGFPKISGNGNCFLPVPGKKNLLESFSSVSEEDSQTDGIADAELEANMGRFVKEEIEPHREEIAIAIEELGSHKDTAAGYESFKGMMESLRLEPSLRDEESLKTLKRIEEKFQRQSSLGEKRRSGDELRQIWKNTLRSFESDEDECAEERATEAEGAHSSVECPVTAVEPAPSCEAFDDQVCDAAAADDDRSVGEKRMSVLEYVWKFEEQLHQLGNNRTILPGKSGTFVPPLDSVPEVPPESKESPELVDSEKNKKSHWVRLRKLATGSHAISTAADGKSATPDADRDRFVVRGEAAQSSDRATRTQDAKSEKSPDFGEGRHPDGSSAVVHDVYEVQPGPRDPPREATSPLRDDLRFTHDIKKYVSSTVNELITGQFIDSQETARCEEHYLFDNGRPDHVAGNTVEEHEANGKGRPYLNGSTESFRLSEKGPGDVMDMSLGPDPCALQSQSSVVLTESSGIQMQGVFQQLTQRLKALEKDRQTMQNTIASLKKENGEVNILQDIAQQLRTLRGGEQTAVNNTDSWPADDPAFVSSIKVLIRIHLPF